jgi:hypothetical protein
VRAKVWLRDHPGTESDDRVPSQLAGQLDSQRQVAQRYRHDRADVTVIERGALVEQIVRLLDIRLLDPLEVLLDADDVVGTLREIVRIRAGRWADGMRDGDDVTAVRTAARLIATLYPGDRAFDPPAGWWQTPLGQTVALRVGHPAAETVSYGTAGAMLGISRQGVHDLVRRGRLPRHPAGGVPSTAVRDRLRDATGRGTDNDRPRDPDDRSRYGDGPLHDDGGGGQLPGRSDRHGDERAGRGAATGHQPEEIL